MHVYLLVLKISSNDASPKYRRSTTFVAGPSLSPSRGGPAEVPTARRAVGLEFLREPLEVPIGIPWDEMGPAMKPHEIQ